jgi:hypothetical protein
MPQPGGAVRMGADGGQTAISSRILKWARTGQAMPVAVIFSGCCLPTCTPLAKANLPQAAGTLIYVNDAGMRKTHQ